MTYEMKIEKDKNGEPILIFPKEIVEKYNLKDGDDIPYEIKDGVLIFHFNKT